MIKRKTLNDFEMAKAKVDAVKASLSQQFPDAFSDKPDNELDTVNLNARIYMRKIEELVGEGYKALMNGHIEGETDQ